MPYIRVSNTTPNIRNRGVVPTARVSAFQTGKSGVGETPPSSRNIYTGNPIGLLLAITYSSDFTAYDEATYYGDFRPNIRITTT